MTKKSDLQKELLEKVKLGTKPSDIKKLKRSKSEGDLTTIPAAPPLPSPPHHLLQDQLQEKQKEIESLRKDWETVNQALKETQQLLDNSLAARVNSLKDWETQQEQIQALNKELDETVEQASKELDQGDSEISQLRNKVWTLKSAKEQLERELKLTRINRRTSETTNATNSPETLQYALYSLLAVGFVLFLTKTHD